MFTVGFVVFILIENFSNTVNDEQFFFSYKDKLIFLLESKLRSEFFYFYSNDLFKIDGFYSFFFYD